MGRINSIWTGPSLTVTLALRKDDKAAQNMSKEGKLSERAGDSLESGSDLPAHRRIEKQTADSDSSRQLNLLSISEEAESKSKAPESKGKKEELETGEFNELNKVNAAHGAASIENRNKESESSSTNAIKAAKGSAAFSRNASDSKSYEEKLIEAQELEKKFHKSQNPNREQVLRENQLKELQRQKEISDLERQFHSTAVTSGKKTVQAVAPTESVAKPDPQAAWMKKQEEDLKVMQAVSKKETENLSTQARPDRDQTWREAEAKRLARQREIADMEKQMHSSAATGGERRPKVESIKNSTLAVTAAKEAPKENALKAQVLSQKETDLSGGARPAKSDLSATGIIASKADLAGAINTKVPSSVPEGADKSHKPTNLPPALATLSTASKADETATSKSRQLAASADDKLRSNEALLGSLKSASHDYRSGTFISEGKRPEAKAETEKQSSSLADAIARRNSSSSLAEFEKAAAAAKSDMAAKSDCNASKSAHMLSLSDKDSCKPSFNQAGATHETIKQIPQGPLLANLRLSEMLRSQLSKISVLPELKDLGQKWEGGQNAQSFRAFPAVKEQAQSTSLAFAMKSQGQDAASSLVANPRIQAVELTHLPSQKHSQGFAQTVTAKAVIVGAQIDPAAGQRLEPGAAVSASTRAELSTGFGTSSAIAAPFSHSLRTFQDLPGGFKDNSNTTALLSNLRNEINKAVSLSVKSEFDSAGVKQTPGSKNCIANSIEERRLPGVEILMGALISSLAIARARQINENERTVPNPLSRPLIQSALIKQLSKLQGSKKVGEPDLLLSEEELLELKKLSPEDRDRVFNDPLMLALEIFQEKLKAEPGSDPANWLAKTNADRIKAEQKRLASSTIRQKYSIQSGDSLEQIAQTRFCNRKIAGLIADINRGRVKETLVDEKRVVEVYLGQTIELPSQEEAEFYLKKPGQKSALDFRVITLVGNLAQYTNFVSDMLGSIV